jgi:hypothetical protein
VAVILKFGVLGTMTVAAVIVAAPPCLAKNNEAEPQTTNEAKDATTRPERRVWVHLDAAKGVVLQESDTSIEWRDACVAPCDDWMRRGPYYRLVGGGLGALAPFTLRASDGEHETVTVRAPAPGLSRSAWWASSPVVRRPSAPRSCGWSARSFLAHRE